MGTSDPQEVLARALSGDRAAFDDLARAFEDRLRAFIRSRLVAGSRMRLDPDEILQETLVRAHRSLGSFKGEDPEAFRRWLTGVAGKTVLRAEEDARRHRTLEIPPDLGDEEGSPTRALRREERLARFQEALDSLSGDHRQVIFLTRIEGLSLKEAAARLERSPGAVRKLFWRALGQLRSKLSNTASLGLPDREIDWEKGDGR